VTANLDLKVEIFFNVKYVKKGTKRAILTMAVTYDHRNGATLNDLE